jgi:aryl-alcohol dehydrogenase-like predicted oxidoreductase
MSRASSIVLGTVQFGLAYGVANSAGPPSDEQATTILRIARRGGIRTLDTAVAYGNSEARLGELGVANLQVMSKLPPLPDDCADVAGWVRDQVAGSLQRLRIDRLHGLSLHRPEQLLEASGGELYRALCSLREQGLVEKIGISIYQPDELERLFAEYRFDMVQSPFNVFDRRLLTSGWIDRLAALGCELHVRSIFLQGLLLMPAAERPAYFTRWPELLAEWDRWLHETGVSALQACLGFALAQAGIAKAIVGVDGPGQLEEILLAADAPLLPVPDELFSTDPDLLNPSRWPRA